ncbi:fimbrial protein [Aquitalea aquatica]|uniref:Type 1 fimbrial protein n=1 Tax=Aquitalea aquatica TaxID=3044273 RepID=A0A838Y9T7_9NEIS|nr:fimbrial protein [Aquitalea magnusonii]MBA4707805.1 type 1 fimbrial protein [Aquitalea magnusonii]
MKKLLTTASAALLLAGIATQAQAYDGSITFTGNISAVTCTITAAGGTTTGSVTLPTVAASSLPAADKTAGSTQFSIALTNCTGGAPAPTQAATWFEASSDVTAAGRLKNTGGATGVDVAIYNPNNTDTNFIKIGQGNGSLGSSGIAVPISGGNATMTYTARYYSTAAVVPGTVVAKVNYTIQYQ